MTEHKITINTFGCDVDRLARRVVDRVLRVYREDYISECVASDPDSLLGLVKQLERALDERQAGEPL